MPRAGSVPTSRHWRVSGRPWARRPGRRAWKRSPDRPTGACLLDLLEANTTATYDDLWRTWVARDEDLPLLDDRAAARARYDAVVAQAADWQLPRPIRDAMRAWRFDEAEALLADADDVLARRAAIESAAADAGLTLPPTLRDAFQGNDGFADAIDEATAEVAAIARYQAAADARPAEPDLVVQVGLWGATPEVDLAAAQDSLRGRRPDGVGAAADAARSVWSTAADVGQGRIVSVAAVGLAIAVALALLLLSVTARRRRRRRETAFAASMSRPVRRMMAHESAPQDRPDPGVGTARPYATLAATPDEPPVAADDEGPTGAGSG